MTEKEQFAALSDLKAHIESLPFQEFIIKPLYAELEKLKAAYTCETLKELYAIKGEARGLKKMMGILKQIDIDWNNLRDELNKK